MGASTSESRRWANECNEAQISNTALLFSNEWFCTLSRWIGSCSTRKDSSLVGSCEMAPASFTLRRPLYGRSPFSFNSEQLTNTLKRCKYMCTICLSSRVAGAMLRMLAVWFFCERCLVVPLSWCGVRLYELSVSDEALNEGRSSEWIESESRETSVLSWSSLGVPSWGATEAGACSAPFCVATERRSRRARNPRDFSIRWWVGGVRQVEEC